MIRAHLPNLLIYSMQSLSHHGSLVITPAMLIPGYREDLHRKLGMFQCDPDLTPDQCIAGEVQTYGQQVVDRVNFTRGRIYPTFQVSASLGADVYKSERLNMRLQDDGQNPRECGGRDQFRRSLLRERDRPVAQFCFAFLDNLLGIKFSSSWRKSHYTKIPPVQSGSEDFGVIALISTTIPVVEFGNSTRRTSPTVDSCTLLWLFSVLGDRDRRLSG